MELSQKLEQRQIISQRLQQSLRILTLNNLELEAAVEQELETNPVLEWEPPAPETGPAPSDDRWERIDWQSYFESSPWADPGREEGEYGPLAAAVPPVTLADHLLRQLEVLGLDTSDLELATEIVSALDRDGYLRMSTAALAEEMGVAETEIRRVLVDVVQTLEPPGVGARDLRETLYLQWQAAEDEGPALAGIVIDKYLRDLATKTASELARALKTAPEELEEAVEFIRSLEPRPGRAFGGETGQILVPDLRVELVDGDVVVTLLDDRAGRLFVSPRYRNLLTQGDNLDEETARFLRYRLTAAASFIRALHQRRRTVEKVAAAIFDRQREFLAVGELGLKPLTMEEVADRVGYHLSTVSRAVAGKVVDTPHGVYGLKYFFTGGVAAEEGAVAARRVQTLLQDLIAEEDKTDPLSDEALVEKLAERGVRLARRTVAKYRKGLHLPGKHERKKRI
ncbi:MAG: RNA polymerase factor sigma-54 [Candidatus Coatesbacteria bacterium]|nr:MAG: RNA polymerase factor sigma-54 [Candidatus Coatesbacteria bacterium]